MPPFPLVSDTREAIDFYHTNPACTDAVKAYLIALLSREGLSNRAIRAALNIEKVYTVTHLKRVGLALSEAELTLWDKNPTRITLGHLRAIAKLPQQVREKMLRQLLAKKIPVHHFAAIAQGATAQRDADIKRYEERMAEVLGRPIRIRYNNARKSGSLTLDFYTLDDLDHLATALGFHAQDYF
ncbi:MAG TPA: transcriptional regulator [Cellvibrio sp.]|nr:transcriptional regulator [Cellvibrio sp.]